MSEEFLSAEELAQPTSEPKLFQVTNNRALNGRFHLGMDELSNSVQQRDLTSMIETLCKIVPTYRPTKLLDCAAARSSA